MDQRLRDLQREYLDFLDDEVNGTNQFCFWGCFYYVPIYLFVGRSRKVYRACERYDSG